MRVAAGEDGGVGGGGVFIEAEGPEHPDDHAAGVRGLRGLTIARMR